MLVQYASDLHLEMPDNFRHVLSEGGLTPKGGVLLLAGDIAPLQDLKRYDAFWDWCSERFARTLFVPGNHDWYGAWPDASVLAQPLRLEIRSNVLCLNNAVERIDGVDFVCSTLWSRIDPVFAAAIGRVLLDFHEIRFGGALLTTEAFNQAFEASWVFIQRAVNASDASRIVVATHHLPSWAAVADQHKGSPLTSGFATELGGWIAQSRVDAWIYGHSHASVETAVGRTLLKSNQLGYLSMGEGGDFVKDKCLTLGERKAPQGTLS